MYTEILIKASINGDISTVEKSVLNYMFNDRLDFPIILPDHEFFTLSHWQYVGVVSSYYHIPWKTSKYNKDYLFSRSDIKNYHGEIESFFDWLRPLCNERSKRCIGYRWYEEDNAPTLIYS